MNDCAGHCGDGVPATCTLPCQSAREAQEAANTVRLAPDYVEHRQRPAPANLTPEAAEAYRRAERCRALLQVVHQVCTQAGVPTDDDAGEPYSAAERVQRLQAMGTNPA